MSCPSLVDQKKGTNRHVDTRSYTSDGEKGDTDTRRRHAPGQTYTPVVNTQGCPVCSASTRASCAAHVRAKPVTNSLATPVPKRIDHCLACQKKKIGKQTMTMTGRRIVGTGLTNTIVHGDG